jgi:hypothetical protein
LLLCAVEIGIDYSLAAPTVIARLGEQRWRRVPVEQYRSREGIIIIIIRVGRTRDARRFMQFRKTAIRNTTTITLIVIMMIIIKITGRECFATDRWTGREEDVITTRARCTVHVAMYYDDRGSCPKKCLNMRAFMRLKLAKCTLKYA